MGLKIPENLTQQAFKFNRDEIIQGKLDGRQHLTENYFAERFGVSKPAVREALNRLESEGQQARVGTPAPQPYPTALRGN